MSETALVTRDLSRDELVRELRALQPVLMKAGVTHLALFGSRARQDNRPDSDVDLAIEVDPTRKFSLIDLAGVGLTVEDSIGLSSNIAMRRSLSPAFLDELRRDGIEIF